MMCAKCGTNNNDDAKVCAACGDELKAQRENPKNFFEASANSVPYIRPALQLPTNRSIVKMIFLGLITLGIYDIVILSRVVTELNISAGCHDGKRTMPFFAMVILSIITLGIYGFVWWHFFTKRIQNELNRRGYDYKYSPAAFWLWGVLGTLIIVGPFVYIHKTLKAMNMINESYNIYG